MEHTKLFPSHNVTMSLRMFSEFSILSVELATSVQPTITTKSQRSKTVISPAAETARWTVMVCAEVLEPGPTGHSVRRIRAFGRNQKIKFDTVVFNKFNGF